MAVLKNKRAVSEYEYERKFNDLLRYSRIQLRKASTRRIKFLVVPITDILRNTHSIIMELNTGYTKPKERNAVHFNLLCNALQQLYSLQKPLYTYWNIMATDEKQCRYWVGCINDEIKLLYAMILSNPQYSQFKDQIGEIKYIMYFKKEDIAKAKFLAKMMELHRFTHGKAVHLPKEYDCFETATMIELVNDAWYCCLMANHKIPSTASEYNSRRQYISRAISDLNKMNRPLLSIFSLMNYSESVMREWSDLLSDELKLLYKLQVSDKKRFSKLEN